MTVQDEARQETPPDVVPGSDADVDHSSDTPASGSEAKEPSPEEDKDTPIPSKDGEQADDNIDDKGRRPDGTEMDQPVNGE